MVGGGLRLGGVVKLREERVYERKGGAKFGRVVVRFGEMGDKFWEMGGKFWDMGGKFWERGETSGESVSTSRVWV